MVYGLELALFPLPNVVLFPKTSVPLFVFEARYLQMIKDCVRGDRLIALAPSRSDREFDGVVCGAGRPLILSENDNGTINILLIGECKVRLRQFVREDPYKVYYAEVLGEEEELSDSLVPQFNDLKSMLSSSIEDGMYPYDVSSLGCLLDCPVCTTSYCALLLLDSYKSKLEVLKLNSVDRKVMHIYREVSGQDGPMENLLTQGGIKPFQ